MINFKDKLLISKLREQNKEFRQAIALFVDRVELGEIRSKKTYEQFKALLSKYPFEK